MYYARFPSFASPVFQGFPIGLILTPSFLTKFSLNQVIPRVIGCFYTKDASSVWTNLGKYFVVRLVLFLKYKDGHKTHYASRLTTFRSASFKTYYEGKFVQASERGTLLAVSRSGYI